jgi:hypothetical protein
LQLQRYRGKRGVLLQHVTQRLRAFIADSIPYRHTRSGEIQIHIQQTSSNGLSPQGNQSRQAQQTPQTHSTHGCIERASPQSTLNSPTSGALHTQLNKKKHTKLITNQTKNTYNPNPATTKSALFCPSERHPMPSLLLHRFDCLQTHPSGETQIEIQRPSSNRRRCRKGNHNNHPLDTLVVLIVAFHNRLYSLRKFSDNEVSVVLSFSASPNVFAPSAPIRLSADTHPSGEIQLPIQQHSTNGAALSRQGNHSNHTRYIQVLIALLQDRLSTVQPVECCTHVNKRNQNHKSTNETKNTHRTIPGSTKSAWCCPSERHPTPSLLLHRLHCLQTHPSGEIQMRIQQNQSQWADTVSKAIPAIPAITLAAFQY